MLLLTLVLFISGKWIDLPDELAKRADYDTVRSVIGLKGVANQIGSAGRHFGTYHSSISEAIVFDLSFEYDFRSKTSILRAIRIRLKTNRDSGFFLLTR